MRNARSGSIGLVADLMLRNRLSEIRRTHDAGLDAAVAALQETDVAIANLEMPLSRRGSKMLKHSNLRSDPDVIEDVRAIGVDAVSLANNHTMDYGPEALTDTLIACDQAGMLRSGAGANLSDALEPAWLNVGEQRVALISVSSTLPLGSEATEGTPGIAPIRVYFSLEVDVNLINEQPGTVPIVHTWTRKEDEELVLSHIRSVRERADMVIVAIHWGVPSYWLSPYRGLLVEYQQPLGHALVDAGADIIFGHHSHSLHGIEVYRGRPIVYSGGNFIFEEPRGFMEPESLIAQVSFGEALAVSIVPLLVDERGLPELATNGTAGQVLDKLAELSVPFGTEFERVGDRAQLLLDR
jgi:poly-gamma-glutamate synthesis protein (capsule biosynthesis protein)